MLERRDQNTEGAGEAIILPDQYAVDDASIDVMHQRVIGPRWRLPVPLPFHDVARDPINIFLIDNKTAPHGVVPEHGELGLRVLVSGGDPRINGDLPWGWHRDTKPQAVRGVDKRRDK